MKPLYFILTLLFAFSAFSQTVVENGKIELNFDKAKKISKSLQVHTFIISKSSDVKTIMVKINLKSLTDVKEYVDVNKFYLIDEKTKSRVKLIDASYKYFTAYVEFTKLIDEKIENKRGSYFKYDPDVTDTFYEYKMKNYQDIVIPINFGTKRKPNSKIIFYKPHNFKKNKLILFFPYPKESNEAILYYGKLRVKDFNLK